MCGVSYNLYFNVLFQQKIRFSNDSGGDLHMETGYYLKLWCGGCFFIQILVKKTQFAWIAYYVDPVVAIVMACFLLIEPVKMIFVNLKNLVLLPRTGYNG